MKCKAAHDCANPFDATSLQPASSLPRSRLRCQPDKVINAYDEAMNGHVADTTMKMQAKLLTQSFGIDCQAIGFSSLLQHRKVKFVVFTTKNLPRYFHIAVGRNVDWRWRCQFFQRQTQRPPAEDIPLLNASSELQPDQLFLGLIRQADLFDAHTLAFH